LEQVKHFNYIGCDKTHYKDDDVKVYRFQNMCHYKMKFERVKLEKICS